MKEIIFLLILFSIGCKNSPSSEKSNILPLDSIVGVDILTEDAIVESKTPELNKDNKDCNILFSSSTPCSDCTNCFVFSGNKFDVQVSSIFSSYFYNCFIDSCGLGTTYLVDKAIQSEYFLGTLVDLYRENICSKSQNYSTEFFRSKKIELLVPLKNKPPFLMQVADSLLSINEIDGIMLLWRNFRYKELSHFKDFWELSMKKKNFFILCDLYILMSINGHSKLQKEILKELEIQRSDFPEYFDRLMVVEENKNLTYYEYFSSIYFD